MLLFFFSFGHWAIFLSNNWKKNSWFVKIGFSVSMETFGRKSFRKLTKCYFLNIERKKFGWLSRKKSAGLSSCFLILHRNILQKKFLKSFCIFADFFRINCGNWAGKVWLACQNFIPRIYINVFWKKKCFGKQLKFFIIFRHWADVFGLLSIFWRVCWNYILRVHRNTLGKKMFFKKYSFPIFLDKKRIFLRNFVGISSAGLSKMKFAGPRKNFWDNFFQRLFFQSFSDIDRKSTGVF